ncbi:15933_t:CDS:1 [Acaulospora morrowiae]|uniref:15933_t:CDS:1 n=1 Tax=Acaulospora morrowiae TaxID=94023 RepID=A0A9N8W780_9GLOM|nr:15933_t:CDS:1 [Acaulospora morrowiae]
MEREEVQQMHDVKTWIKNSLGLSRNFRVKDIHIREANVTLTGGADISIGPTETDCVWIEAKKRKEDFKKGQAMGELLLLDKLNPINSMTVLTDCNDNWNVFFFVKVGDKNEKCIVKSKIGDRGIALAVIKLFVLEEGNNLFNWLGWDVEYQVKVDLPAPLQKRTKFFEHIPEAYNEDRIADIVGDMSRQELFNMDIRRGLKMLRNLCRLDEQPQIDRLIRQFSDDYEDPPPLM